MQRFRTYQLARDFYLQAAPTKLPRPLGDQLRRAAASVALNLAEGYGRESWTDQRRFFTIALGSVRECQAVFELTQGSFTPKLHDQLDHLAASLWRLLQAGR